MRASKTEITIFIVFVCVYVICLTLALFLPKSARADTLDREVVDFSTSAYPLLYVHTRSSLDIQLGDGEQLEESTGDKGGSGRIPLIADHRWITASFSSGSRRTLHVIVKPSVDMPDVQDLVIPTSGLTYHVKLRSGPGESTAYAVAFYTSPAIGARAMATPAPKVVTVTSCMGLDAHYRVTGDARVPIESVCDDGVRTFVLFKRGVRGVPAVAPYRVDWGGKQDQIMNPVWDRETNEWVLDGVFPALAFIADSSTGQIRKNIIHFVAPPARNVARSAQPVASTTPADPMFIGTRGDR